MVWPYCFRGIGFGSKWGWSYLRVPNTCHEYGLKFKEQFQFQVGVILLLGNLVSGHFSSWRLLVTLTAPSKLGFQVEVTLLEDHRLPTGTARE